MYLYCVVNGSFFKIHLEAILNVSSCGELPRLLIFCGGLYHICLPGGFSLPENFSSVKIHFQNIISGKYFLTFQNSYCLIKFSYSFVHSQGDH